MEGAGTSDEPVTRKSCAEAAKKRTNNEGPSERRKAGEEAEEGEERGVCVAAITSRVTLRQTQR